MSKNLQTTIDKGLRFLGKDQEKDGSFMCLASDKMDDYSLAEASPNIVPTNIVLSSLNHIADGKHISEKIKKKVANFLLSEKSDYWSINYWFRNSDRFRSLPYPDDVDDTFCALAALYEYKPALFDGKAMAKIVTMLTSAEKEEGGPYDMWLVPPEGRKTWNYLDLVVNANVSFFLSLQDVTLPKVTSFIEKSIDEKDYEFPYNKIYPAIYFISRFYKGKRVEKMVKLLLSLQERNGKWENPLRTALAISSLMNFSGDKYYAEIDKGIKYLLSTQRSDGSWQPSSFFFQLKTKEKTQYAGSSSTTTALCLEAINKFALQDSDKVARPPALEGKDLGREKIYTAIARIVKNRFSACDYELRREAVKIISKTLKGDKDRQITLLPYFFKSSLGKLGKSISDNLIVKLGAANTFGWIAYTIYDDFLDNEGDQKLLSVANVALRESSEILGNVLGSDNPFSEFSKKTFDIIDGANAWEISRAGLKTGSLPDYADYSQLANKSLGHLLGPIAILFALGYGESSSEIRSTMSFFKNYIIARQLNDDAHDWEDDLKHGHINAVAVQILKSQKHPNNSSEVLQRIFWEKTIVPVCKDIIHHLELARHDLRRLSIVKNRSMFERMLLSIENSANKALKEREETLKFLKTYTT